MVAERAFLSSPWVPLTAAKVHEYCFLLLFDQWTRVPQDGKEGELYSGFVEVSWRLALSKVGREEKRRYPPLHLLYWWRRKRRRRKRPCLYEDVF